MRESKIRLMFGAGLELHEKKAAKDAAARFKPFGLEVESIEAPSEKIWKDSCREQFFKLVFGNRPLDIRGGSPFYRPIYAVPYDGALLAGITAQEIFSDSGKAPLKGFSLYGVGAVVSVAGLRAKGATYRSFGPADDYESAAVIKLGLIREIGHSLLGTSPQIRDHPSSGWKNCTTEGCLLESDSDYLILSRRGVEDFCKSCTNYINGMVTQIKYLGCA